MPTQIKWVGEWEGGIPAGGVSKNTRNKCFYVRFAGRDAPRESDKKFKWADYTSEEDAREAAEEYRRKRSNELVLTKNQHRKVELNGVKYVEMRLQKKPDSDEYYVALMDLESLPIAIKKVWGAGQPNYEGRFYVSHNTTRLHTLLRPQWRIVDHINRNGLDNRLSNLRDGTVVNLLNSRRRNDNTSGAVGVYKGSGNMWVGQIYIDGRPKTKSFSIARLGDNEAKAAAIEWREEMASMVCNTNGYESDEAEEAIHEFNQQ